MKPRACSPTPPQRTSSALPRQRHSRPPRPRRRQPRRTWPRSIRPEVLSNPERRAQYDQTGDDKPQASIRDQATGVLADLFAKALEHDENVVSVARRSIEGAGEEARACLK